MRFGTLSSNPKSTLPAMVAAGGGGGWDREASFGKGPQGGPTGRRAPDPQVLDSGRLAQGTCDLQIGICISLGVWRVRKLLGPNRMLRLLACKVVSTGLAAC